MYYTIGQVSKIYNLPVSTLRYYDNEGLIPNLRKDKSGKRQFSEKDLETIKVIECLKKSGLEIKEIKQFMDWCQKGSETYIQRKNLFEERKRLVEEEIGQLSKVLNMLKYKCWYYEETIKNNNEDIVKKMIPFKMPEEIRKAYENTL